jgi:hypothetical protein
VVALAVACTGSLMHVVMVVSYSSLPSAAEFSRHDQSKSAGHGPPDGARTRDEGNDGADPSGGGFFGIQFSLGSFMPGLPPGNWSTAR